MSKDEDLAKQETIVDKITESRPQVTQDIIKFKNVLNRKVTMVVDTSEKISSYINEISKPIKNHPITSITLLFIMGYLSSKLTKNSHKDSIKSQGRSYRPFSTDSNEKSIFSKVEKPKDFFKKILKKPIVSNFLSQVAWGTSSYLASELVNKISKNDNLHDSNTQNLH